jgi:hypothetical protein
MCCYREFSVLVIRSHYKQLRRRIHRIAVYDKGSEIAVYVLFGHESIWRFGNAAALYLLHHVCADHLE